MVSYTEPKTLHHVFESDYETYFVTPFYLVVFVFVSSLPFFISFYVCSFLYVFSISVSLFQILNAKNTTLIQNFASCFCLQLDYITIYFPYWLYLSKNLFHQFLSKNHLRQIWHMVEVRRLLRCPGCLLGFAKCMIKRNNKIGDFLRLYTFYVEVFSLLSIATKFITVQGRVYNS